ncbi:MAG: hypothetical protein ACFE9A_21320, partial [Candidatus Hodarchaeota archaeon]
MGRLMLVLFFFLTCVIIPVFNVLPFLERTRGVLGASPEIIRYYHDALSYATSWSLFGIGEVTRVPGMVLSWLEWIIPFLGTLTLVLGVWVTLQEIYKTQKLNFSLFQKVSFLAMGSIWLEWVIFFYLILGEEWGNIIPEVISPPPIPNTFLLELMLLGTFALLWASSITPLKIKKQVSSTKIHNLQESKSSKEYSQKNRGRLSLRVVLIACFFFTCVSIPFLRLTPFIQISLNERGGATFFFDHFSENGYMHPYLRIPYQNALRVLLGMSGWVFIGFG